MSEWLFQFSRGPESDNFSRGAAPLC